MKKYISDILLFCGAALIVAGAAMIHVPAALVIAGAFLIWFAFLIEKDKAQNAPVEKPGNADQ